MYQFDSSVWVAVEEANFLLHRIWIHILGSEYHPLVKSFTFNPEKAKVDLDSEGWLPLPLSTTQLLRAEPIDERTMAEQQQALETMFSRDEQEAVSDLRSRAVHFTILARQTDSLEVPETYQLTFTIYLHAKAPQMEWQASVTSEIKLVNVQTGEVKALPSQMCVLDCMNKRFYPFKGAGSRFERAKQYFA